jgi:hypothetical protein
MFNTPPHAQCIQHDESKSGAVCVKCGTWYNVPVTIASLVEVVQWGPVAELQPCWSSVHANASGHTNVMQVMTMCRGGEDAGLMMRELPLDMSFVVKWVLKMVEPEMGAKASVRTCFSFVSFYGMCLVIVMWPIYHLTTLYHMTYHVTMTHTVLLYDYQGCVHWLIAYWCCVSYSCSADRYLWYYWMIASQTHLIWTACPSGL